MGRRFPGSSGGGGGGGGGGGVSGKYNQCLMWNSAGTYTWTTPSDLDESRAVRVYVWGGGGSDGCSASSGQSYGGGGGGLAISELTLAANTAYTVTVGAGAQSYTGNGGTSSFSGGSITTLSASGGRSGHNNTDPTGNSTGETSNPQASTRGQGGVGVGGNIVNRRGGRGGYGQVSSSSGYGGGGGSAPAPDGFRDGYPGGDSTSYQGGSGASIYFPGTYPYTSYCSAGGAGTAGMGSSSQSTTTYYAYGGAGGAGLDGAGGRGGSANTYSNTTLASTSAGDGQGSAIWSPNLIFLGGGGGGGGAITHSLLKRLELTQVTVALEPVAALPWFTAQATQTHTHAPETAAFLVVAVAHLSIARPVMAAMQAAAAVPVTTAGTTNLAWVETGLIFIQFKITI